MSSANLSSCSLSCSFLLKGFKRYSLDPQDFQNCPVKKTPLIGIMSFVHLIHCVGSTHVVCNVAHSRGRASSPVIRGVLKVSSLSFSSMAASSFSSVLCVQRRCIIFLPLLFLLKGFKRYSLDPQDFQNCPVKKTPLIGIMSFVHLIHCVGSTHVVCNVAHSRGRASSPVIRGVLKVSSLSFSSMAASSFSSVLCVQRRCIIFLPFLFLLKGFKRYSLDPQDFQNCPVKKTPLIGIMSFVHLIHCVGSTHVVCNVAHSRGRASSPVIRGVLKVSSLSFSSMAASSFSSVLCVQCRCIIFLPFLFLLKGFKRYSLDLQDFQNCPVFFLESKRLP